MKKSLGSISGHWRIIWMEEWDQEYVTLVEPGYLCMDSKATENSNLALSQGIFTQIQKKHILIARGRGFKSVMKHKEKLMARSMKKEKKVSYAAQLLFGRVMHLNIGPFDRLHLRAQTPRNKRRSQSSVCNPLNRKLKRLPLSLSMQ